MGMGRYWVFHGAAAVGLVGLLTVVLTLPSSPARRWAIGGVGLLVVGGGLALLFGSVDGTAAKDHRRHAVFVLTYCFLTVPGTHVVGSLVAQTTPLGQALHLLIVLYGLAVAGWLGYLDGVRLLQKVGSRSFLLVRRGLLQSETGSD